MGYLKTNFFYHYFTDSSKERTEQKKSESNGYVYDFYYANDNLGQLGDM